MKGGTTKRVVDTEAGVVLYAWPNAQVGSGVGLAAVALSQTELDPEDFE